MINEEAYPESFNIDDFSQIKSFKGRLDYANNNLKRLGSGSARVVYKVDEEKVLKIAKNNKGIAQNSAEIDYRNSSFLFPEVFDFHNYSLWVEMEYAKKMTTKKFIEIIGYEINQIHLIFKKELKPKELIEKRNMIRNNYLNELVNIVESYKFMWQDFTKLSSWGIVLRDGKETPVLVDFGYTTDVYYKYYAVS